MIVEILPLLGASAVCILHSLVGDLLAEGGAIASQPLGRALRRRLLRAKSPLPLLVVWALAILLMLQGSLFMGRETPILSAVGVAAFVVAVPVALLFTLVWRDVRSAPGRRLLAPTDRQQQQAAVRLLPRLQAFASRLQDDLEHDIGGATAAQLRERIEASLPDLQAIRDGLVPSDLFQSKLSALGSAIAPLLRNERLEMARAELISLEQSLETLRRWRHPADPSAAA